MQLLMPTARAGRKLAVLTAVIAITTVTAVPGFAAPNRTGGGQPLAVSVPSDAASLRPGATGTIPIRIVNPGSKPVTVRITGRKADFGDNGRVTISGPDPRWAGRVAFPTGPLAIAPRSYDDVGLTVRMPARLSPDLYFIGFLVTPISDVRAGLRYVNQIGSYITVDVPGPRTRALAADIDVPGFTLSGTVHATVHVHNVGKAAAIFWGENDTSANPGSSSPRQQRFDGSLLPIGRSRVIAVTATPTFLVSAVTMRVRIIYPGRTAGSTEQIVLTKRVWVVQPAAPAFAAAIVIGCGVWLVMRRRKRRPRRPRHGHPRDRISTARKPVSSRRPATRHRQPVDVSTTTRVDRMLAKARAAASDAST